MNKSELSAVVAKESEMTQTKAKAVIDSMTSQIIKALARGDRVVLGGFGHFVTVQRSERQGTNPKTGAPMKIEARTQVKFRPSKWLKAALS